MKEESLKRFVERLNADPDLREEVRQDAARALVEFDLRSAEEVTRASDDEDVLRRLASVSTEEQAWLWTRIKRGLSRLFCGPGTTRSWECPKTPSPGG
jgi:hypothetical protein